MRPSLPRRLLHDFWIGLTYVGASAMGGTPEQLTGCVSAGDKDEDDDEAAAGDPQEAPPGSPRVLPALPPPGHPERLVLDEPLAEEASRLWDDPDLSGWPSV